MLEIFISDYFKSNILHTLHLAFRVFNGIHSNFIYIRIREEWVGLLKPKGLEYTLSKSHIGIIYILVP